MNFRQPKANIDKKYKPFDCVLAILEEIKSDPGIVMQNPVGDLMIGKLDCILSIEDGYHHCIVENGKMIIK